MQGARPVSPRTLDAWLEHLERLHPATIDLGLERVRQVRDRLGLEPDFPIVTVGGTNGKGSTCAFLEAMLTAAGHRVGCYTSPHLLRYNERVRVGASPVDDEAICRAFQAVEAARGEVSLTYFEFGTLAAMWLFMEARVDAAVLEVGLGGRLDAVNVFDPQVAVVTSVDLDHMEYLGPDRESIGREKAGIYRGGRPAICADPDPPASLRLYAHALGAELRLIGTDFGLERGTNQWRFWRREAGGIRRREALPLPALVGEYQLFNAAAAIEALESLAPRLIITQADVRRGLQAVQLPGRFQVLPGRPHRILDVAHNPHGARALAANLAQQPSAGRTLAVFAMLADKDVAGVVKALADQVDEWFLADLPPPRGADGARLAQALEAAGVNAPQQRFVRPELAYRAACLAATQDDRILIFGSFYTVAAVLAEIRHDA